MKIFGSEKTEIKKNGTGFLKSAGKKNRGVFQKFKMPQKKLKTHEHERTPILAAFFPLKKINLKEVLIFPIFHNMSP